MKRLFTLFFFSVLFASLSGQTEIADAREASLGSVVTVKGIVTSGSELGDIRYLQDETAGIAAFPGSGSAPGFTNVKAGDELEITGILKDFNGLLEISPINSFTIISSDNELPEPKNITAASIGEFYESQLVRVGCVDFAADGNFNVGGNGATDANGESFNIYINPGNPIEGDAIPEEATNIIGIVTAFNNPQLVFPASGGIDELTTCFTISKGPEQLHINPNDFKMYWETSAEASSVIKWGTTLAMENEVQLSGTGFEHQYTITDLEPATFYYVQIECTSGGSTVVSAPAYYSTGSNSSGQIRVFFNHDTDASVSSGLFPSGTTPMAVKDAIIERIDLAQSTVDIAIYNINDADIVSALNDAVIRGVNVRLVADQDASNNGLDGPLNFDYLLGNSSGLMHNKFLTIDADSPAGAWVIMGSMNFSEQNIYDDYNNVIIFQDQAVARAYRVEFEEMWGGSGLSPNPSSARFGSQKTDNTPHKFKVGSTYMELYFAPSDGVAEKIENALETVDNDLSMALLLITQNRFRDKILDLNDGSRWIRGIIESINILGSDFNELADAGVDVYHHDESGQFHHKYAIIDAYYNETGSPMVINGSYNWSASAEEKNDENTIIWRSYNIANLFLQEFNARWEESATSTIDLDTEMNITAYPVPFMTELQIELEDLGQTQLSIYNTAGALVETQLLMSSEKKIDTRDWKTGMYILDFFNLDTGKRSSVKVLKN